MRIRMGAMGSGAFLVIVAGVLAEEPKPGSKVERKGDEIVVCGQLFHTTAPVVTWMDPGGYDAYRVERRFAPWAEASWEKSKTETLHSPNRFGLRKSARLTPERIEKVRGGGWDLPTLQDVVDQFVIHFDVCGTSQRCFKVLQDERDLSVHFMLDIDGTIYQTLDLKEGAWHATKANGRSIGIEIANMGTVRPGRTDRLDAWYERSADGQTRLKLPTARDREWLHNPGADLRPSRNDLITGNIQGEDLAMYDLTPAQYDSLIKLTATLCTVFPKIQCDYPRDPSGKLIPRKLPDADYDQYQGILGHYHVQANKNDPGPALQWDRLVTEARKLIGR